MACILHLKKQGELPLPNLSPNTFSTGLMPGPSHTSVLLLEVLMLGEGLVKHVMCRTYQWRTWLSGGVAQSRKNDIRSWSNWVVDSLGSASQGPENYPIAIQKSEATHLDIHLTSRYITACDDFFQTFPMLVLKRQMLRWEALCMKLK